MEKIIKGVIEEISGHMAKLYINWDNLLFYLSSYVQVKGSSEVVKIRIRRPEGGSECKCPVKAKIISLNML